MKKERNLPKPLPSFIIKNFKKSKLFKPSKYEKTTKFGPKKLLKINDYEKPTEKEEWKNKANFQNPFLLPSTRYKKRPNLDQKNFLK